jgi:hypothetical protein
MSETVKFGEFLIDSKIIKQHDLIIALEKQKLFGGKIGENLCDIGCFSSGEMMGHLKKFRLFSPSHVN